MAFSLTPARRAFLDTIAWSEGAGYTTMFTGKVFHDFQDHPRQLQSGGGYTSDAAGRYQFLSSTWDEAKETLQLEEFNPENQDQAALLLVQRRGALELVDMGNISKAIAFCSWEWASFPYNETDGRYGQPTHTMTSLLKYYQERLEMYEGANVNPTKH